jgi:hypothetical protein
MEAFRPITEEKPWSLIDEESSPLHRECGTFHWPRFSRRQ